jgi:dihydropteroate synthase
MKKNNSNSNLKRPIYMGILNITPDSFSDGGKFNNIKKAIKQAKKLEKEGADIIDIGGESTGPNSKKISAGEEIKRVIPILKELKKKLKIPISIDTYKYEVAKKALEEGADIINDVTALRGSKKMGKLIAKYKCPIILMYSKDKTPRTTIKEKKYKDVISEIKKFLELRINYARKQGISKKNIIIDPGMGHFISKIPKYSFEVIAKLEKFKKLKCPILIGTSRKSFMGEEMNTRLNKAKVLNALACINGASIIRTHEIKEIKNFIENAEI